MQCASTSSGPAPKVRSSKAGWRWPGLSVVETWGSTLEERTHPFPCDGLIERPDTVLFRAVDVAAPSHLVFGWLCQLRVAPYSYDWIDNLGRKSPHVLNPELEVLGVGQRFMTIFRLVSFDEGVSITLDSNTVLFGRVVCTYRVTSSPTGMSRLVAKVTVAARPGPLGILARTILPGGDLVMMRKQLRTLKTLAERDAGLIQIA